ncbi:MAG TPA: alpha/beta family hydrolase [Longimicrobiales bacterium]|nr:alpha/beta family hydrolase [Longimicrobiales bacterium]
MPESDATAADARRLRFPAGDGALSALLLAPLDARVLYVFAHGAGAGMEHAFMAAMAERLAARRVATFRFQFPYLEAGRGRPDRTAILTAAVRAAVEAAALALPDVPLMAGGKSMGGRMSAYAQAEAPLPGVRGLAFTGFPLHPPRRPGTQRAEPLARVRVPMLFLQGTRDELASLPLMREVCQELGERARLHVVEGADHGFHVLKRSGRTDEEVLDELADGVAAFGGEVAG